MVLRNLKPKNEAFFSELIIMTLLFWVIFLEPTIRAVKTRIECRGSENQDDPALYLTYQEEDNLVQVWLIHNMTHFLWFKKAKLDGTCDDTLFYLIPVGLRQVAIQHIQTNKYIAINKKAKLIAKDNYDVECTFKEGIFENYWTTYSSLNHGYDEKQKVSLGPNGWTFNNIVKHCNWHMAINSRGHRMNSKKSRKNKSSSHFIPRAIEGKCFIYNES